MLLLQSFLPPFETRFWCHARLRFHILATGATFVRVGRLVFVVLFDDEESEEPGGEVPYCFIRFVSREVVPVERVLIPACVVMCY